MASRILDSLAGTASGLIKLAKLADVRFELFVFVFLSVLQLQENELNGNEASFYLYLEWKQEVSGSSLGGGTATQRVGRLSK